MEFDKVSQSNSRFNALDMLNAAVHVVKMPVGFGGIKSTSRTLASMVQLNRSIVEVGVEEKCLAHALIIAIALKMIRIIRHTGRVVRYVQWSIGYSRRRVLICKMVWD